MDKKTIPVKLIFDDWVSEDGEYSIYDTESLSSKYMYAGAGIDSLLTIDENVADEIKNIMKEHSSIPSFLVKYDEYTDAYECDDIKDNIFEEHLNLLKENEELKKRIKDLESEIAGEDW